MALELTSSFEVLDPRFRALVMGNVHVEKLYTGTAGRRAPPNRGRPLSNLV